MNLKIPPIVTDRAFAKISSSCDTKTLRVAVKGGGCSGFQYVINVVENPMITAIKFEGNKTISAKELSNGLKTKVGDILNNLEWDVKAYFTLGGAVHDAAISAWGIKGWYDYIRPISAIRFLAEKGQSSNPSMSNYAPNGIPLEEGYIELVEIGDSLAGADNEHIGKIKLKAWRGPEFISNPENEVAGVGWILAENWWPYQRLSFHHLDLDQNLETFLGYF